MTLLQNSLFYAAKPTIQACDMNHSSVRYELFHHAIWALSGDKTDRFAKRIKTGCNTTMRKRLFYNGLPILSKFTFFVPYSPSVRSDAFFPHFSRRIFNTRDRIFCFFIHPPFHRPQSHADNMADGTPRHDTYGAAACNAPLHLISARLCAAV